MLQWPILQSQETWLAFPKAVDLIGCEVSTLKKCNGPALGAEFRIVSRDSGGNCCLYLFNAMPMPDTPKTESASIRISEVIRSDAIHNGTVVFKVIATCGRYDQQDLAVLQGTDNEADMGKYVLSSLYKTGMLPFITPPLAMNHIWQQLDLGWEGQRSKCDATNKQSLPALFGGVDLWATGFVISNHLLLSKQSCNISHFLYRVVAMPDAANLTQRLFLDWTCPAIDAISLPLFRFITTSSVETVDIEAILMQIFFTLQVFYEIQLVHWDLHANNILVTCLHKPKRIVLYIGDDGEALVFYTRYIITVVDFELSAKFKAPLAVVDLAELYLRDLATVLRVQIVNPHHQPSTGSTIRLGSVMAVGIRHDRFRRGVDLFTILGGICSVLCCYIPKLFDVVSPNGTFPSTFFPEKNDSYWIPVKPPLPSRGSRKTMIFEPLSLTSETMQSPIRLLHSELFATYLTLMPWDAGGPTGYSELEGIRIALPSVVLGCKGCDPVGAVAIRTMYSTE